MATAAAAATRESGLLRSRNWSVDEKFAAPFDGATSPFAQQAGAAPAVDNGAPANAERPQVLAQLAKDISDLIHSTRNNHGPEQATQEPQAQCSVASANSPRRAEQSTWLAPGAGGVRIDGNCQELQRSGSAAFQQRRMMNTAPSGLLDHRDEMHDRRISQEAASESQRVASMWGGHEACPAVAQRPSQPWGGPPMPRLRGVGAGGSASCTSGSGGCERSRLGVPSDTVTQPTSDNGHLPAGQQEPEVFTRQQREMQSLLSHIESREAALRDKVQQLTAEKNSQQQRLEEELLRLKAHNERIEEELRRCRQIPTPQSEPVPAPPVTLPPAAPGTMQPQPVQAAHAESVLVRSQAQESVLRNQVADQRPEPQIQILAQGVRSELQQQLDDIRTEVKRCAQALCAPEKLPSTEVADIREQLAALHNDVMQTSRSLLPGNGVYDAAGTGSAKANSVNGTLGYNGVAASVRDAELAEVRQQLEALQSQVSTAMATSLGAPGVCDRQPGPSLSPRRTDPRASELSQLRCELDGLKDELARAAHGGRWLLSDEASLWSTPRSQHLLAPQHAPHVVQTGNLSELCDLNSQMEALRAELSRFRREPSCPSLCPCSDAATELQGRLGAVRDKIGRVIREQAVAGGPGSPELNAQLSNLFAELHDLRRGAETLAARPAAAQDTRRPLERQLLSPPVRTPWSATAGVAGGSRAGTPSRYAGGGAAYAAYAPSNDAWSGGSPRYVDAGPRTAGAMQPSSRYVPRPVDQQPLQTALFRSGDSQLQSGAAMQAASQHIHGLGSGCRPSSPAQSTRIVQPMALQPHPQTEQASTTALGCTSATVECMAIGPPPSMVGAPAPQDRPRRPSRTKLPARWQDDAAGVGHGVIDAARVVTTSPQAALAYGGPFVEGTAYFGSNQAHAIHVNGGWAAQPGQDEKARLSLEQAYQRVDY